MAEKVAPGPAVEVVREGAREGQKEDRHADLRRRLLRAVRRVCPSALADRAEDIVQVGMLRLLAIFAERGEGHVATSYLRAVAYSATIDEIRRARARLAGREEPAGPELAADGRSPEEMATDRELGGAIRDCLGRLPEPRQLAVTFHLQGHTVPEAAGLLDWSEAKTRNLVYRGLADLRECLDRKGVRR